MGLNPPKAYGFDLGLDLREKYETYFDLDLLKILATNWNVQLLKPFLPPCHGNASIPNGAKLKRKKKAR